MERLTFDDAMPEFRDPGGMVWVWDAESKTYVQKPSAGLEQDRGHATGGDNDLFNQNQLEHSELAGVPELEGYMAKTAQETAKNLELLWWHCLHDRRLKNGRSEDDAVRRADMEIETLKRNCRNDAEYVRALQANLRNYGVTARFGEWAPKGQVKCPQCTEITDQRECPVCHKDLTPEWNNEDESNNEFFGQGGEHSDASEFTSWPERVPKRNREKTDDAYPSMALSSQQSGDGRLVKNDSAMTKPDFFAHYEEELAWREANTPSLAECPECRDPMADQGGESICHGCGHKQPIIMHNGAAAAALPMAAEALGGGGEAAGGLMGGMGGMDGGSGLPGIGQLMNSALRGTAFQGGEQMLPGGGPSAQDEGGGAPADPSTQMGVPPGVLSKQYTAGIVGDLVEWLLSAGKSAGEAAGGAAKGLGNAMLDPKNPLSYADDVAGVGLGAGQMVQQGTPSAKQMQSAVKSSLWSFGGSFGEEEEGRATKNRGDNSDPEQQSSSGADVKERGDGPEQLKDIDGPGDAKGDAFPEDDLGNQGDPAMQDKALKALHLNLPLVIEFANSDEPGSENPILMALDQLLEEAFPGYKGGTGEGEDEHPVEEVDVEIPSNDGEPKEEPEGEGDTKQAPNPKNASLWHFAWENEYDDDDEWADRVDRFADPGGNSALHPATKDNPRNLPCPSCGQGNALTPADKAKGYQCDRCADELERYGHIAGASPWGTPGMPAQMQPGAPAMQAPGATGVPTCPMCGQSHLPGTPCPTDPSAVTAPTAQGAQITPPMPNKVVTKWQVVAITAPEALGQGEFGGQLHPGACESCGDQSQGVYHTHTGAQCPTCAHGDMQQSSGKDIRNTLDDPTQWGGEPDPRLELIGSVADNEFAFFTATEEGEHHQEHEVHHHHDSDDSPWQDEHGAPLQKGAQYELKSSEYAIPDRITVDRVLPDKLVYTTDSGEVKYRNEITAQDVATNDYTFAPLDDSVFDSSDGIGAEHPVRPGQDAIPQVDDLSTPQTVMSAIEPASLENYTGSFRGDAPDDRSWLMDDSSAVEIDPVLMAKFAGKDYSAREQREFIDEKGEARNLDLLALENTHYIVSDDYGDALW